MSNTLILYIDILCSNGDMFKAEWTGEGIVALYVVPNPFLRNKICLNQRLNEYPYKMSLQFAKFKIETLLFEDSNILT